MPRLPCPRAAIALSLVFACLQLPHGRSSIAGEQVVKRSREAPTVFGAIPTVAGQKVCSERYAARGAPTSMTGDRTASRTMVARVGPAAHHVARAAYGGDGSAPPAVFRVLAVAPNPFHQSTSVRYELPSPAPVVLEVYAVSGRQIARVDTGIQPAGRHTLSWDGRDRAGRRSSSGIYFYRLHAGRQVVTGRVLLMK